MSVRSAAGPFAQMGTAGARSGATARYAAPLSQPLRQASANLTGRPELNISGASSGSGSALIANGSMVFNSSNISRGSVAMMTPGMAPMQVGVGGMTPAYARGPGGPPGPIVMESVFEQQTAHLFMESVAGVRGVGPGLAQGRGSSIASSSGSGRPLAAARVVKSW